MLSTTIKFQNQKLQRQQVPSSNPISKQDQLEKEVLLIKAKLEQLDKLQKIADIDPQFAKKLKDQRLSIAQDIDKISVKFGVDVLDVYAKLESEAFVNNLQKLREWKKEEEQKHGDEDIIDLYDENQILLRRGKRKQEAEMLADLREQYGDKLPNIRTVPSSYAFLKEDMDKKKQKSNEFLSRLIGKLKERKEIEERREQPDLDKIITDLQSQVKEEEKGDIKNEYEYTRAKLAVEQLNQQRNPLTQDQRRAKTNMEQKIAKYEEQRMINRELAARKTEKRLVGADYQKNLNKQQDLEQNLQQVEQLKQGVAELDPEQQRIVKEQLKKRGAREMDYEIREEDKVQDEKEKKKQSYSEDLDYFIKYVHQPSAFLRKTTDGRGVQKVLDEMKQEIDFEGKPNITINDVLDLVSKSPELQQRYYEIVRNTIPKKYHDAYMIALAKSDYKNNGQIQREVAKQRGINRNRTMQHYIQRRLELHKEQFGVHNIALHEEEKEIQSESLHRRVSAFESPSRTDPSMTSSAQREQKQIRKGAYGKKK